MRIRELVRNPTKRATPTETFGRSPTGMSGNGNDNADKGNANENGNDNSVG